MRYIGYYIFSVFVSFFSVQSISNAQEIEREYDLENFTEIRIDDVAIELKVDVGDDYKVVVEGHEVNVQNLKLKVFNEKLVLYRDDDKKSWDRRGNSKLAVKINMPEFNGLELRGAVDASIEDVDSDVVIFDLKGAGNIEVDGRCTSLVVDLKGAGNFEADDLECEDVTVDLKGAGNIQVYASQQVDAEIKGMGNIDVYGNPEHVSKDDGFFSNIDIH